MDNPSVPPFTSAVTLIGMSFHVQSLPFLSACQQTPMEFMACLPWVWNRCMNLMAWETLHTDGMPLIPGWVPIDHKGGHRLVLKGTLHSLTHRILMVQNQLQTHGMGCWLERILHDHHSVDQYQNGGLVKINIGNHGREVTTMIPGMEHYSLVLASGHMKTGMHKRSITL